MEVLKVSSKSSPNSVAGAIAGVIRDYGCVEVQAVGRGYLAPMGVDIICIPAFTSIEIDGAERTAMKLLVEIRWLFGIALRFGRFFTDMIY